MTQVYAATELAALICPSSSLDGTVEATRAYVERIKRTRFYKTLYGFYRIGPSVVEVEEAPASDDPGSYDPDDEIIRLTRDVLYNHEAIADPWVVLHELAHHILDPSVRHDRTFMIVFHCLVKEYMSAEHGSALKDALYTVGARLPYTKI